MTTLDARARHAAHAINAGIAEFSPASSFDTLAIRQHRWRTLRAGLAGAVAAVIVVLAGVAITPSPDPEVADPTVTTVVVSTLPPEPNIVVPVVPPTTQAPETTTTSVTTSTAATSTTAPDTTPPPLSITSPGEGEHFEVDVIEFRGTTEPGATVFAGQYEATVDGDGAWSIVLVLSPGANGARFVATDAAGNQSEAKVTVYYDVPEATTTTTSTTEAPKEEVEFTAYNVHGTSEQTPPFDVYWGTAPPGSPIFVESEYGGDSTTANENGDWELRVYFPDAPGGVEFTVKVRDDTGQKYLFGFKYLI
jgi:hypothetical protein